MFSDRIFQITLLISLAIHGVILFNNPDFSIFSINKREQKLELSYLKDTQKAEDQQKIIAPQKEPLLDIPSRVAVNKKVPPPFIDKENIFKRNRETSLDKPIFNKPVFVKPDIIAVKKKITLPPIDIDKINNPSYISYYQIVREKIKRAAYRNYTRTEVGEVFLSFIILNDGLLKDVYLKEERSTSNPYLKEIALRSITASAPFPIFPKELNYPQLSFNVVISFQIE